MGQTTGSDSSSNSTSNGVNNQTTSGTVHGTGMTAPVNAPDIVNALDYAHGTFLGPGGDVANAASNIRTYGDRALGGAGAGSTYANNVLGGNYLNSNPANAMLQPIANGSADGRWSNPYADAAFDSAASKIEGRMRGAWGNSDVRPGGGLEQGALGGALADLGTGIYLPTAANERANQIGAINQIGANYAGERTNQMGALSMVPGITSALTQPGLFQMAAAGQPIKDYSSILGSISPGTTSTRDIATSGTMSGTTNSNGSTSGSGKSTGLSI